MTKVKFNTVSWDCSTRGIQHSLTTPMGGLGIGQVFVQSTEGTTIMNGGMTYGIGGATRSQNGTLTQQIMWSIATSDSSTLGTHTFGTILSHSTGTSVEFVKQIKVSITVSGGMTCGTTGLTQGSLITTLIVMALFFTATMKICMLMIHHFGFTLLTGSGTGLELALNTRVTTWMSGGTIPGITGPSLHLNSTIRRMEHTNLCIATMDYFMHGILTSGGSADGLGILQESVKPI